VLLVVAHDAVLQNHHRGSHTLSAGLTQIKRESPVSVGVSLPCLNATAAVRLMACETCLSGQAVPGLGT
jgi:hypothetical protein